MSFMRLLNLGQYFMENKPTPNPANDNDQVLVKSPGGGSISHGGTEYFPDANNHILIPRAVFKAVNFWTHTDPHGRSKKRCGPRLPGRGRAQPGSGMKTSGARQSY